MDLNYVYHRHAVSLHNARLAACPSSRRAHHEMAEGYARILAEARVNGTRRLQP